MSFRFDRFAHTTRVVAVLVSTITTSACAATRAQGQQTSSWERVFEVTWKDAWLSAINAGRPDRNWIAGGKDILVTGSPSGVSVQRLDGLSIMSFGNAKDGTTFAVGSHGTIWKRHGHTDWRQEHQLRPPGSRGKVRDEGLLLRVQQIEEGDQDTLFAYGPRSLVLIRRADGTWQEPQDASNAKRVTQRAKFGPDFSLPKGCSLLQWQWIDNHAGLFVCHDHRSFVMSDGVVNPSGSLPALCTVLWAVARRGNELFASCGDEGVLYQYRAGTWGKIPNIRNVRAVSADEACVYAAEERAVWRQCI